MDFDLNNQDLVQDHEEKICDPDDAKPAITGNDAHSGGDNSDSEKEDQQEEDFKVDDSCPLEEQFPMRNTFTFGDLTISSNFDAGNLRKCVKATTCSGIIQKDKSSVKDNGDDCTNKFDMWISCDGLPYRTSGMRTWFYFYVLGAKKNQKLKFSVKNMNNQGKLLKMGLRPVYRVIPKGKYWQKVSGNTTWSKGQYGLEVNFEHTFTAGPSERVYFAFTYPFSYHDIQQKTLKIEQKLENKSKYDHVYYHKELLGRSIENRRVDLITLTSKTGMTEEHEDLIENCFPEHEGDKSKRPFKFENKKTVFLSARVHPGETPASFVLNGIFDILLNTNRPYGKYLLDLFVFKIIPCLNPDGCSRGYFRLDTKCQNLNRYYQNPTIEKQPTIYVTKQAIIQQSNYGVLQYYIDLHAHATKVGCFLFGNAHKAERMLDNLMLAKMISMNSLNFDITECCFSEKNMKVKDSKSGLSREGSGRVGIYKATDCTHCYTLECNYASGKKLSHLPPKYNKEKKIIEPESYITDPKSYMYRNKPPVYNIDIFENIGRATMISFLDLANKNPISRVPKSIYKDVENMRLELSLQNNINVAEAKKRKEVLLRKKLEQQERATQGPQPWVHKRAVITPNTSNRISKLHRGQSCIGADIVINKEEEKPTRSAKPRSSSLNHHNTNKSRKLLRKQGTKYTRNSNHLSIKQRKKGQDDREKEMRNTKELNCAKIDNIKENQAINPHNQSHFRLEKKLKRKLVNKNYKNGSVKGIDEFLRSRSKQPRQSVKLSEINPCISTCGYNRRQDMGQFRNPMENLDDSEIYPPNTNGQNIFKNSSSNSNSRVGKRNASHIINGHQNLTGETDSYFRTGQDHIDEYPDFPLEIENEIKYLNKPNLTHKEIIMQNRQLAQNYPRLGKFDDRSLDERDCWENREYVQQHHLNESTQNSSKVMDISDSSRSRFMSNQLTDRQVVRNCNKVDIKYQFPQIAHKSKYTKSILNSNGRIQFMPPSIPGPNACTAVKTGMLIIGGNSIGPGSSYYKDQKILKKLKRRKTLSKMRNNKKIIVNN
ncbi:unnamed protein product [Moneuplotes crassus]|uniref:tubulin-glutamate carboxypeptidase n=1 Tax=Euplotes crassus TaxID=5936 RepID=A0AAD1UUT0_EUPCR|nr:unnamed protein product [Moneuplotes crassus]